MFQGAPVLLGQYRPLGSFLHRLDARSKILPVTLVLVLSLATHSFTFYTVIMAALVVSLLQAGIGLGTLLRNFRPVLILVLITALYHIVFSQRDSVVILTVFGWTITRGALEMAGFYSLRLILFVSIAFLVTITSSPSELAEAFTKMLRPLKALRIPVQELGMIIFMAIRFIPILYEEFSAIRNAQIIRGVDFSGSLPARVKKTSFIIIPVIVAAIQRADELALAIEARGYRYSASRTFYTQSRFGANEWFFATATMLAIAALFVVTRQVSL